MVAVTFAEVEMVSAGTRTVISAVHRGSLPPDGQLLPGAADTRVPVMTLLPGSGFSTVSVPVTVITPPTGMDPVQVMAVDVSTRLPAGPPQLELATWSPVGIASSTVSALGLDTVIPVYGTCPVLVKVAVRVSSD